MTLAVVLMALQVAAASPAASPTPPASPRFTLSANGSNVFVDQSTVGPGTTPPEGAGFAMGSPLSPMSPYDWFSSAPVTPGVAGIVQYAVTGTYALPGMTLSATLGLANVTGSMTNALYWSEPLLPNLDVHAESHAIPYAIAFPVHAGQDDASVFRASLLGMELAAKDDRWRLRGGFFDLLQSDSFVFAPPAITSVTPSLGPTTATTLGPGIASIDAWPSSPPTLPLLGIDAFVKHGSASAEFTDALMPSLAGTSVHLTMGSAVLDRGAFGRFSVQLAHLWSDGSPILTTTYFGASPQTYLTPQGRLFTSVLANQVETIGGVRAFLHPAPRWDVLTELGRAWYDAGLVSNPGTQHFGNYEHFAVARHVGDDLATIEYHRFDPTYATMILPYGVPENVWSAAWSWPGVWLKSTYQVVDNTVIGANRAGFHFKYDHKNKRLEAHADYGDWRQLVPETFANASQNGFVDGYFLLQNNLFPTYGHDRHIGLYIAWHLPKDDVAFDGVEDYLNRDADPGHAIDTVAVRTPAFVGSVAHHVSSTLLAVGGYGRYEAIGQWATTPVDAIYGVGFAGVEFATGPKTELLVEARRYGLVGLPSAVGGLPPTLKGTVLVVDQRVAL
ncbi:MAG: hypothetical protein JO302_00375 [Candidatus Eremiobacteraeota bacterium]|nr:hypothetical protein [Candidatus Eremiobacteraeota bacterium]